MTEKKQGRTDEVTGVELVCDGLDIPLNPFVRRFIKATVGGMVDSLEGIPDHPRTIELKIREK